MKKIILSTFVILSFITYSVHKQREDLASSSVVVPDTITSTNPPSQVPANTSTNTTPTTVPIVTNNPVIQSGYKDGQYTGIVIDAYYGNVQVKATISGGKITEVQFLDYPHDRGTSIEINNQAMPLLKSEAIRAQNAQVDVVSGATQTSLAFIQSLQSALDQAK